MIVLGIIECIIGLAMFFVGVLSIRRYHSKKSGFFAVTFGVVLFVVAIIFFTVNYDATSYTPTYNKQTNQSHECYVCGEDAHLKYGSHYYCNTHYAMVKTIVES